MQLKGQTTEGRPGCHQGGKSSNNGLICLFISVTLYSTVKNIFLDDWQKATKTMFANKDKIGVVYMLQLLCAFNLQYSNNVDFISMGEAQMGAKGPVPN